MLVGPAQAETDYKMVAEKLKQATADVVDAYNSAKSLAVAKRSIVSSCALEILKDIADVRGLLEDEVAYALRVADYNDPMVTKVFGSLLKEKIGMTAKYASNISRITSERAKFCYSKDVDALVAQALAAFKRAREQFEVVQQELPD